MSPQKEVRIEASIRAGWAALHANLGLMLGLGVAYAMAVAVAQVENPVAQVLATVVEWVLMGVILLAGIYIMWRDGAKVPGVADMPLEAGRMLRFLGVTIATTLITILGLLLLVVPGVVFALKYGFASAFVLDEDLGVGEALKRSAELTDGVKWRLFVQGLAFGGVILLGLLALLVGVVPALMTVLLAWSWTYVDLRKQEGKGLKKALSGR